MKRSHVQMSGGLTQEIVNQIRGLLRNLGSVPLGKITRQFPGVTKGELEQYFVFSEGQNPVMMNPQPGVPFHPPPRKMTKEERVKRLRSRDMQDPSEKVMQLRQKKIGAPLDHATLVVVEQFLQSKGGTATMGELAQKVKGIKKNQLQDHFNVEESGTHQATISLWFAGVGISQRTMVQTKKPAVGLLQAKVAAGGMNEELAQKISQYLIDNGGSMMLGKLSQAFTGVKKKDLEKKFRLTQESNHQFRVSVDAGEGP